MSGATLKQVEKLKYLEVTFSSDGKQDEELDTRIGKASAVMQALYYSVAMTRELSKTPTLSIFETVFVPILTNGRESYDRKSAITSASVRNEVFTKNRRSYSI